jgi:hypothetical protein
LIYTTPEGNDFDDCIIIIDLDDPYRNQTYIKDFSKGKDGADYPFDHLFYEVERSILWVANRNFMMVAPIKRANYFDEIQIDESEICYYDPCAVIWGFFPDEDSIRTGKFAICFETLDHQLDFNIIEATSLEPDHFQPTIH